MKHLLYSKFLRRLLRKSDGFTIVEVIVVTGILSLALSYVGTTVFQSLSLTRFWRSEAIATKTLRHAGSVFVRDALLVNQVPEIVGDTVTLRWVDAEFNDHTAKYTLDGTSLIRTKELNGLQTAQNTVAQDVVSVSYTLDVATQTLLTINIEIQTDLSSTESISLQTFLRLLAS